MRKYYQIALGLMLFAGLMGAQAKELQLSLDVPQCKTLPGKPLPGRYYKAAKEWKEFSWVKDVKSTDWSASGSGLERADGSGIFGWYTFDKLDMNGDGVCDWFVTMLVPYSSGTGGTVLNTLYLGSVGGWKRIGASIPSDMPDELGAGNSTNQREKFGFSSGVPFAIADHKTGKLYFIGIFDSVTDSGNADNFGYQIYAWDADTRTLKQLNKWEPGSAAAQVYEYFKRHGAVEPTEIGTNRIQKFQVSIEEDEFLFTCSNKKLTAHSPGFAQACKEYREKR